MIRRIIEFFRSVDIELTENEILAEINFFHCNCAAKEIKKKPHEIVKLEHRRRMRIFSHTDQNNSEYGYFSRTVLYEGNQHLMFHHLTKPTALPLLIVTVPYQYQQTTIKEV